MLVYNFKPKTKSKYTGIALAVVVAITAIACSKLVRAKADISDYDTLSSLSNSIDHAYLESDNFKGLNTESLISSKIYPEHLITSEGTLVNKWGGQVLVSSANIHNNYDGLQITYKGVPWYACEQLILDTELLFDVVQIQGKTVKAYGSNLIKEIIHNDCITRSDAKSGTVDITYLFKKTVIIIP